MSLLTQFRQLLARSISPQNPDRFEAWRERLLYIFLNLIILTSVLAFLGDLFSSPSEAVFGALGIVITLVARVLAQRTPKVAGWFLVAAGVLFVRFALSSEVLSTTGGGIILGILALLGSVFITAWAGFVIAVVTFAGVLPVDFTNIGLAVGLGGSVWLVTASLEGALKRFYQNARMLQQANAELRKIQAELEARVAERTQELSEARDQAVDALRAKSQFLANVSHDLRTPINAILGYLEMLQEGVYGPLAEKQPGVLSRIEESAKHLLTQINELLDQSRLEARQLTLRLAPFAPAELIEAVQVVAGALAQGKGLRLTCQLDDDLPAQLHGDFERLRLIALNLLNNAIKFTDQGEVSLRLHQPDADWWALEVSDTGCGIPSEAHGYIFEPFRQVDATTTRKHGGVGLGLSIVKQLTELMGGQITLVSQVDHGSTFIVRLPLTVAGEASA